MVVGLGYAGCRVPTTPPAPTNPPSMTSPKKLVQHGSGSASAASMRTAAAAQAPVQLQIDLYHLSVPFGTVSGNEAFWKRVDEQAVDVATYDLLLKNGVRVGVAPVAEWERFRRVIEDHPAVTKSNTMVGATGKSIELPVRKEMRWQNIFYFNADNRIVARTFDDSENLITMTLQSAPRKPDTMRIALCPMVRGTRKKLEYSVMNNELGEVAYVAPERLYDLNLRADVDSHSFLVVAPSAAATWPTSIGNSFFVTDGPAERMETVLLIVPRTVKFEPSR
jgi:hypothetical protein